ncbi:MAG: hypothetical protein Q8O92_06115 [Candidatus Latescibacter sp.]|nr:hypothetical protein [Candidatus Latescibacter sp.]
MAYRRIVNGWQGVFRRAGSGRIYDLGVQYALNLEPGGQSLSSRKLIRQQVAEDMLMLIKWFEDTDHADRTTFKQLVRVFNEQCTVEEKRVIIKEKAGGPSASEPFRLRCHL